MSTFDELFAAAQGLPPGDRLRLAEALWEDVSPRDWPLPSPEVIAEAQRRSALHDQGVGGAETWEELRDRARREVGLDE